MAQVTKLTATDDELLNLRSQGWKQTDIADAYGVSRGLPYHRFNKLGVTKNRPRYAEYLPWVVATEHNNHVIAVRLRWIAHREANRTAGLPDDDGMPAWALPMADTLIDALRSQDAVVTYDVMSEEGFKLVRATPAEKATGAIIREP